MDPKETIKKNLKRRSSIIEKDLKFINEVPLPKWIELSLIDVCNRSCSFCPKSDDSVAPDTFNKMERVLIDKLTSDLIKMNYSGTIALCGYGEPLLHKDILYITEKLSSASSVEIITNGDALNFKRAKKLFDSGLSTLLISVYDGAEEEEKFYQLCKELKLNEDQYVIRNRYMSADNDFGLNISNRSGNLENSEFKIEPLKTSLKMSCNYPAYTFFIDYNGDVQMCSHDWGKKYIIGNIKNEKIINIWKNEKYLYARKKLLNANRNFSPCNKCDVEGSLIGNKHAKEWLKRI